MSIQFKIYSFQGAINYNLIIYLLNTYIKSLNKPRVASLHFPHHFLKLDTFQVTKICSSRSKFLNISLQCYRICKKSSIKPIFEWCSSSCCITSFPFLFEPALGDIDEVQRNKTKYPRIWVPHHTWNYWDQKVKVAHGFWFEK